MWLLPVRLLITVVLNKKSNRLICFCCPGQTTVCPGQNVSIMRKVILILFFLQITWVVWGQQDPLWVLKVRAAEAAGLDTTRTFREELSNYRHELSRLYLTDSLVSRQYAMHRYENRMQQLSEGEMIVGQLFFYLPQNATTAFRMQAEQRMDSLYMVLQAGEIDFSFCVERYSEDKNQHCVHCLQMPAEWKEQLTGLQPGEFSKPFYSPKGLHMIKLIECCGIPTFDTWKQRQSATPLKDEVAAIQVEELKKKYDYRPNQIGINELLNKGKTDYSLFTLQGRKYTGKDFARFASSYSMGLKEQLEYFVLKSLLDYAYCGLEQQYPDFHRQIEEFRTQRLVSLITHREVIESSLNDEAALAAYYDAHRTAYYWEKPRYQGAVLHCTTKKVAKQVRKFLKRLPQEEWQEAIRLTFQTEGSDEVQAEVGLYACGDNPFVDKEVFKGKNPTPILSHPFTVVMGRKIKGPENYKELREQVLTDYQHHLKQEWEKRLQSAD